VAQQSRFPLYIIACNPGATRPSPRVARVELAFDKSVGFLSTCAAKSWRSRPQSRGANGVWLRLAAETDCVRRSTLDPYTAGDRSGRIPPLRSRRYGETPLTPHTARHGESGGNRESFLCRRLSPRLSPRCYVCSGHLISLVGPQRLGLFSCVVMRIVALAIRRRGHISVARNLCGSGNRLKSLQTPTMLDSIEGAQLLLGRQAEPPPDMT